MQWPAENELGKQPNNPERHGKRQHANEKACPQIGLQRARVNLRAREKGEHAASKQGEEIDPFIASGEMEKIPGNYANEYLDKGHRDSDPNRHQTRNQRERHPNCSDEPNVSKNDVCPAKTEPNVIEHNKTPAGASAAPNRSH